MRFLRTLLTCLVIVASLAVLCLLVLIAPAVQTFVAQHELAKCQGITGTLGSLSAGFGEVTLEDLHLEADGAVLSLPSFQAKMSVTDAVLQRRAKVKSLVADGWTLDLSHATGAASAASARDVVLLIGSMLKPWDLPVDLTMDDVEMEGDVLLPSPSGPGSTHMHVRVTGGNLGPGRDGSFTVETTGDVPAILASSVGAHGNLLVTMDTPRTFSRIRLTAGLTGLGGQGAVTLSAQADIPSSHGPETLTLKLVRGDRELLSVGTNLPRAGERQTGKWSLNVKDSDVVPFAAGRALPSFSASGAGSFDADLGFESVHVTGGVHTEAALLSAVSASLARVGSLRSDSKFEFTHASNSVHVTRFESDLRGASPVGTVRAIQEFDADDKTGTVTLADPSKGWLDVAFTSLPLAWLPDLGPGCTLSGNDAKGELVLTPRNGGFGVRLKSPLLATDVTITKEGRVSAKALDIAASLEADITPGAWELRLSPLVLNSAGGQVARIEAKVARTAGDDQPVAATGTWTSDIAALAAQGFMPAIRGFEEGKASGDFSATFTDSLDLQGNLLLAGATAQHSISSAYHVGLDSGGGVSFVIPLKIEDGKSVTDLSAEGTSSRGSDGHQIDLKLNGGSVSVGDLLLVAGPLASAGSGRTVALGGTRDATPFWGDWTGHVVVSFDRLRMQGGDLLAVGGVFDIDHGGVRLTSGHGGPEHHTMTSISGSLAFDASAATPYSLKATSAPFDVEAKALFAVPHSDDLPVFEGHYSVAPSLVGFGINLQDLTDHTVGEFRLSSTSGIVRILGANVATSLHERSAPVVDTLGTVGSAVGGFLGSSKAGDLGAKNKLSKAAEAALDLGNQLSEIGCDLVTLTARRTSVGAFTLSDIEMTAPGAFLKGSGTVGALRGVALLDQPLSLDLQIGAKGRVAELLGTAGIAAPSKDAQGFTLVSSTVHFGGTPAHVDSSGWQQLLAQAASKGP